LKNSLSSDYVIGPAARDPYVRHRADVADNFQEQIKIQAISKIQLGPSARVDVMPEIKKISRDHKIYLSCKSVGSVDETGGISGPEPDLRTRVRDR